MAMIKGQLTQTESAVGSRQKEGRAARSVDFAKSPTLYEVKGNGVTLDMNNTAMQSIKTAKETRTPAVVFEINMGTGTKKVIFQNDVAIHTMAQY